MEGTKRDAGVATCLRRVWSVSGRGAGAFWLVAVLAFVGAPASTAGAVDVGSRTAAAASGGKVDVVISSFQFCLQAPCQWPTEAAYARDLAGPVDGTDNPNKFVAVSPGDTITWTYEDVASGGPGSCDWYGTHPYPDDDEGLVCPGHTVALENGSVEGNQLGFLAARSGRVTLTWVVPAEAKAGSVIRYFCNVRDLYTAVPGGNPHSIYGMTGGLKVRG